MPGAALMRFDPAWKRSGPFFAGKVTGPGSLRDPGQADVAPDLQVGFFGKLPVRGDFVRAGLPHAFVAPWDAWLQRVLPAALTALADDWLNAPVWRFRLP